MLTKKEKRERKAKNKKKNKKKPGRKIEWKNRRKTFPKERAAPAARQRHPRAASVESKQEGEKVNGPSPE